MGCSRFCELNWLEWVSGEGVGNAGFDPTGHDRLEANRAYVSQWRDVVLAAETQQLSKIGNRELQMPGLPRSWPKVRGLEEMPCAL